MNKSILIPLTESGVNMCMKYYCAHGEEGNGIGEAMRLDAVVVYEDFETGLRASQTLEQAVQRLEEEVDVQINLWRFDLFRESALRQRAAREAADADLVFVSAHGQDGLPASVNRWLEEWFARKGGEPSALALLFDSNARATEKGTALVEGLDAAARLAGVEVFLQCGAPRTQRDPAIEALAPARETSLRLPEPHLTPIERQPLREWGINE